MFTQVLYKLWTIDSKTRLQNMFMSLSLTLVHNLIHSPKEQRFPNLLFYNLYQPHFTLRSSIYTCFAHIYLFRAFYEFFMLILFNVRFTYWKKPWSIVIAHTLHCRVRSLRITYHYLYLDWTHLWLLMALLIAIIVLMSIIAKD